MIYTNPGNIFHLQTEKTSYIFRAMPSGHLESLYYGKRIRNCEDFTVLFDKHECGWSNSTAYSQDDTTLSLDHIALEYSSYGKGDYRLPAVQITSAEDNFTTDFLFQSAAVTAVNRPLTAPHTSAAATIPVHRMPIVMPPPPLRTVYAPL